MAVDSFMLFQLYTDGAYLPSESQVDFSHSKDDKIGAPFVKAGQGFVFEVTNFDFDVEQTINMSSQSSGTGAGKIAFNSFNVSRKIDVSTPQFFLHACKGTPFQTVSLGFRKAAGVEGSGLFFLRFDFSLVALKTMKWAHDEESPTEDLSFDYGAMQVIYGQQLADGSVATKNPTGWNKIKNIAMPPGAIDALPAKITTP